jgi:4-aminobutyrate aminotransferase-like enzyme/Ser/Thr protein kinase RdoA (MazF antagonist)
MDDLHRADVLEATPPRVDEAAASDLAAELFGIEGPATSLGSERDQNFKIVDRRGDAYVLKISNAGEAPAVVEMENEAVLHVARTDPMLPVPRVIPSRAGDHVTTVDLEGNRHLVRMITYLDGDLLASTDLDDEALRAFGITLARLGRALRGFFHPAAGRTLLWDVAHALELRPHVQHIEDSARRALVVRTLDRFEREVRPVLGRLRTQVIHGDLTLDNALFDRTHRVSGVIDFGDMSHTTLLADVASTLASVMGGRSDPLEAGAAALRGYQDVTPLEPDELRLLPALLATRLAATVTITAWRLTRFPENADYIAGWDDDAWPLLQLLDELGPDEPARRLESRRPAATADLLIRRDRVLGPAMLPLSYARPLHLVRGEGVWLIDAEGCRYLDAYNNVPVVGHAHPRVADAIARQSRLLNTNTRYLFESVVELAERLLATMPEGIDTVAFVNSGSEANDLAWRLARAATGGSGGIVTDLAYHGITTAIADLSPEEWGHARKPYTVETIPAPDGYRGSYREDADGWGPRSADHLDRAVATLAERDVRPAALYVDSGFTSDGIFVPPAAYLQGAVRRIHDAGGLFVADEVQAGYGRFGSHMWSFDAHDVTPDLVTLGKPMGNGHPVAAVLTRRDLMAEMARSAGTYFSTFGGNPVACAAALAVLDVLEEEDLQARAAAVGGHLLDGLRELARRHEAIGDVRGRGLLIGVELVRDRGSREPDGALAEAVADGLRERGALVGTTGTHGNVLKIRPPLVFERPHAELLLDLLDEVLGAAP